MLPAHRVIEGLVLVADGGEPVKSRDEIPVLPAASASVLVNYAQLSQAVMRRGVKLGIWP
jgi:hypothetical protein